MAFGLLGSNVALISNAWHQQQHEQPSALELLGNAPCIFLCLDSLINAVRSLRRAACQPNGVSWAQRALADSVSSSRYPGCFLTCVSYNVGAPE